MIAALVLTVMLAATPAPAVTPVGLDRPVATAVAGPAPADTLARVPGSSLRLGWRHERTATLGAFPVSRKDEHAEVREGEIRWFGGPAKVALTYREGRLAEVTLRAEHPSPRLVGYVPDELIRLGFRLQGATLTAGTRTAEYEGPCHVHLVTASLQLVATVTPKAGREAEPAPRAAGTGAADSTNLAAAARDSAGADSSSFGDAAAVDFTDVPDTVVVPVPSSTPGPAERPQIAVDAGVFGRVLVRALVGTDGTVRRARVLRGIPELDHAALDWASRVRFQPYLRDGVPTPFLVVIPVAFLPGRTASGDRP